MIRNIPIINLSGLGNLAMTKEQITGKMLKSAMENNLKQFQSFFDPNGKMKEIAGSRELPGDPNGPATKLMKELKEKFENGYWLRTRGEKDVEIYGDSPYFPCNGANASFNKTPTGYKIDNIYFLR